MPVKRGYLLVHHEYWPTGLFYLPLFFAKYVKYSARFRSLNYFCWANPNMENGGLIGYSKYKVLKLLPESAYPKTVYIDSQKSFYQAEFQWLCHKFKYPFIVKPDQGARGYGVKLIKDLQSFKNYHGAAKSFYMIQEYLPQDLELGVFVLKDENDFKVTSVIKKEFLSLLGDGHSTLKELFFQHDRAKKYLVEKDLPLHRDHVLAKGENLLLEPIGNHCLGTRFISANYLVDESFNSVFSKLAFKMKGFDYGRFDIKANSIEEIHQGKFKVMEVNGISAEPGHIYDSQISLRQAYKDLFWHWDKMAQIAEKNWKLGVKKESWWKSLYSVLDYYRKR